MLELCSVPREDLAISNSSSSESLASLSARWILQPAKRRAETHVTGRANGHPFDEHVAEIGLLPVVENSGRPHRLVELVDVDVLNETDRHFYDWSREEIDSLDRL